MTYRLIGRRLAGMSPPGAGSPAVPLSQAQTRVLRYLPTHLPVPEIAGELCVSDRLRCRPGPGPSCPPRANRDAFPGMPSRLGLAECEMEVLRLVAAGRGDRDIASDLPISPKTASVYVSDILAKLGVCTRTEAAATVHQMHVLDGQCPPRP